MATFYWVGATAASFNSFSWDVASNWRMMVYGGNGSTANPKATLVTATRAPMGGDFAYFGRPYMLSNAGMPAPFNILSPCLFGGVTTAANKWWSGATAGGTTFERFGPVYTTVHPSYPFAQIGGIISHSFMSQWYTHLLGILGASGMAGSLPWSMNGSAYSSSAFWTTSNWFGTTSVGLSAANQPSTELYSRGTWTSYAKYPTWTRIYGVSAATAGATGSAYDGSGNIVYVGNWSIMQPYTSPAFSGATGPRKEGDNMVYTTGMQGTPYGSPYWGTQISVNDTYYTGYMAVSGHWNSVESQYSPRNLVFHNYGHVNAIKFTPTTSWVGVTQEGAQSRGIYFWNTPGNTTGRVFDIVLCYHAEGSSARVIDIASIDQIHSLGIRILGNVTPTSGFPCASPAGISSGVSGGVQLPNGSVRIVAPYRLGDQYDMDDISGATSYGGAYMTKSVVYLGFAQPSGSTATTTVTNLYAELPTIGGVPTEYTILGNYSNSNSYMNYGTLSISEDAPPLTGITVSNLYLYNSSVFDMANAPQVQGRTTVDINAQSNSCVVKPNVGTSLKIGNIYSELIQSFQELKR